MNRPYLRGLFQPSLSEGELVRLIYSDEAGTSAKEKVAVVAAILVHGDKQVRVLEQEIARVVKDKVPEQFQQDFYIHTTDIFHGSKPGWREQWSREDRLEFIKEIARLPFVHDIPVAAAMSCKTTKWNEVLPSGALKQLRMTSDQYYHLLTFANCMERADLFLRKYLGGQESGMIIAEDEPVMKGFLSDYGLIFRDHNIVLEKEACRSQKWQSALGVSPEAVDHRIDCILEVPHFVKKTQSRLIQLADVIAFSFRRCLEKQSHGNDLVCAVLGLSEGTAFINEPAWFDVASKGLFNTDSFVGEEALQLRELLRQIGGAEIINFDRRNP